MPEDSDDIVDEIVADARRHREEAQRHREASALRRLKREQFQDAWSRVSDSCIPLIPDERTPVQYFADGEANFIQLGSMLIDCGWSQWLPSMLATIKKALGSEAPGFQDRREQLFVVRMLQLACDKETAPGAIAGHLSTIEEWISHKTALAEAVGSILEFFQTRQQQADNLRKRQSKSTEPSEDDLLTIDEISKVAVVGVKVLRNRKVLGAPSLPGGGRGKKAKWHYLDKKAALESEFGREMPSLEDVRRILSLG